MRRTLWAIAALVLMTVALPAAAQVSMELQLNRSVYMQYEPVYAKLKLRNYSGQPLVFGVADELKGEVLFEITRGTETIAKIPAKDIPVSMNILMPGASLELVVPISQYYQIEKLGTYRVHAYLKHKMLKDMFRSNECRFEVNPGVEVWKRTVGIPDMLRVGEADSGKKQQEIKERTFSLRVMGENAVKHYYLVIEDKQYVYAVLRVGREVGMERYKVEVDMLSRLHLLIPISPKLFRYAIVNLDGRAEQDKYLKTTKTIPSLVLEKNTGRVYVAGGAEALPGVDYQPQEKKGEARAAGGAVDPVGRTDR